MFPKLILISDFKFPYKPKGETIYNDKQKLHIWSPVGMVKRILRSAKNGL